MKVVIQVDLRVCVLVVLALLWAHWERRSFERETAEALRKELSEIKSTLEHVHEDLQTLKSKTEAIIDMLTTGITIRKKQSGKLEMLRTILCRVAAYIIHPLIGTICDFV